jgi:tetratricopeptide (TPR) repeat protein
MRSLQLRACVAPSLCFAFWLIPGPNQAAAMQKAAALASSGPMPLQLAMELRKEGRFEEAIVQLRELIDPPSSISDKDRSQAIAELGILHWNIGLIPKSKDFFRKAGETANSVHDPVLSVFCENAGRICDLYTQAKDLRNAEKYAESTACFEKAISIARQAGSRDLEVKCLRQLSANAWATGRLELYVEQNRRALTLAKELNHQGEISVCHNNIGLYYWKSSDYSQALKHLQAALDIALRTRREADAADCMTNLGLVYFELGDYENALDFIRRALDVDAQAQESPSLAIDYNNLGLIQKNLGISSHDSAQLLAAAESYARALDFAADAAHRFVRCAAHSNLGEALAALGKPSQAIMHFQAALAVARQIGDIEIEGQILNNLANIYLDHGFPRLARGFYEITIASASLGRFANPLWEAYDGLGRCLEKLGDPDQAMACYRRAIDIIDHTRSRLLLETYKIGYTKNKLRVYEKLIHLLWETRAARPGGEPSASMFDCIEKIKARAFLECLSESSIDPLNDVEEGRRRLLVEAMNRISVEAFELARRENEPEKKAAAARALAKEENDYLRLLSNLKTENPAVAALGSPKPIALKEMQGFLDDRTAVIEYFLAESRSYALFASKDASAIWELPARDEIERLAAPFIKLVSAPPRQGLDPMAPGARLCEILRLGPLGAANDRINKLIIIPDGILHFLPFEALAVETPGGARRYLAERFTISYAPSASVLVLLQDLKMRSGPPRGILAFGNPDYRNIRARLSEAFHLKAGSPDPSSFRFPPLPFSQEEVEAAAEFFPQKARKVYMGDQALEERLKENSRGAYQIVHFACHGLIDEVLPYRSSLLFSSTEKAVEDGILHVWELFNLRLRANLVVLSACQTGLGAVEKAEGVLGLTRIFFYTGASSVLSTLWSIGDRSTAVLMKNFYQGLSKGLSKADALKAAKMEMMHSPFSHPYYWAGFIISGDASSGVCFDN